MDVVQWVCQIDVVRKARAEEHPDGYMASHLGTYLGGWAAGIVVPVVVVVPDEIVRAWDDHNPLTSDSIKKHLRFVDAVSVVHVGNLRVLGRLVDLPWAQQL